VAFRNFFLLFFLIISLGCKAVVFKVHTPIRRSIHPIPTNSKLRITSYPYITGDTFRVFCDFVIDETQVPFDTCELFDGATIFVAGIYLPYFFSCIHPKIENRYIIVTHNDIDTVPGQYSDHLADEKLIAWFGKNADSKYAKMIPIPLGLANPHWPYGNLQTLENIINNISGKKNKLLYLNFSTHTHSSRRGLLNYFAKKSFSHLASRKRFGDYLKDLSESHFVLSPPGTSIDCLRTWEALYVGCIPIIKSSVVDDLYKDLPVLIVKDWHEINEQFLLDKLEEIKNKDFNLKKLYADYWFDLIRKAAGRIK